MSRHKRIQKAKKDRGVNDVQIAAAAGCSQDYVRKIMLGKLPKRDTLILLKIEEFLGLKNGTS